MSVRLVPDKQWFRSQKGNGVLAGSPLTYFGVTDAGSRILDAIETNSELPTNHAQLTDRLLATGAVHPLVNHSANPSDITVVIPAFVANEREHSNLAELVAGLSGLSIIVVDDASPYAINLQGIHIIRLPISGCAGQKWHRFWRKTFAASCTRECLARRGGGRAPSEPPTRISVATGAKWASA